MVGSNHGRWLFLLVILSVLAAADVVGIAFVLAMYFLLKLFKDHP